jgi:hypothetical protein
VRSGCSASKQARWRNGGEMWRGAISYLKYKLGMAGTIVFGYFLWPTSSAIVAESSCQYLTA